MLCNSSLGYEKNDNWYIKVNENCLARLKNGIVTITGESSGRFNIDANQYTTIATLPEKYKPLNTAPFYVTALGGDANMYGMLTLEGEIRLYTNKSSSYWRYEFTYQIY